MRLLCLVFPRLGIQLARRSDPTLASRPVALLAGDGEAALLTVPSVEATAAGVETGMTAGQARERCPSLQVMRDNAGECLDTLQAIASILRSRATTDVAIVSRDAIIVSLAGLEDRFADEGAAAGALARLARSWSGLDVRAGVAGTVEGAMAAARTARRFPVTCTTSGPVEALPASPGRISGRAAWGEPAAPGDASRRLERLLATLELALETRAWSFREVAIVLDRPAGQTSLKLRASTPLHRASEGMTLIRERLGAAGLSGATVIEVTLGGLGPSVRVEPWRPAVARMHALAGPAAPLQRRLQLAS